MGVQGRGLLRRQNSSQIDCLAFPSSLTSKKDSSRTQGRWASGDGTKGRRGLQGSVTLLPPPTPSSNTILCSRENPGPRERDLGPSAVSLG